MTLAVGRGGDLEKVNEVTKSLDGSTRILGFYKLFARTWRSLLQVTDFELIGEPKVEDGIQDFVAIDRFTGSAADQKKFKAHGLWRPAFKGDITIRLDRLDHGGGDAYLSYC